MCGVSCNAGFTLCAGRCVNLATDTANCGACGTTCTAAHGVPACQSGRCTIASCLSGYADCNGSFSDGCEAALDSPTSCGRCGVTCPGGCVSGACSDRLLDDDLESGAGEWILGGRWFLDTYAYSGRLALRGSGLRYPQDCSVTSMVYSRRSFDLSRARTATLDFASSASFCAFDTIEVVASTDGGRSWASVTTLTTSSWALRSVNLARYVGAPVIQVGFRFTNICEDVCGTEWFVDDIRLTAR